MPKQAQKEKKPRKPKAEKAEPAVRFETCMVQQCVRKAITVPNVLCKRHYDRLPSPLQHEIFKHFKNKGLKVPLPDSLKERALNFLREAGGR